MRRILFYHPFFNPDDWLPKLKQHLPETEIFLWQQGAQIPQVDYALIWKPTREILAGQQQLKAIMALGAGVDAILDQRQVVPELLPSGVPLYRLQDSGMVKQMQEYTIAAVMRYFRRFDDYARQQTEQQWHYLPPYSYADFTIGVMGLGVLGSQVAQQLAQLGFSVKGWSRRQKQLPNVMCYAQDALSQFLQDTRLLINLLPATAETHGILNYQLFSKLNPQAFLINIARGKHLQEEDLLRALDEGQLKAATLDVFQYEPLPNHHPFWRHPAITITPHISAITLPEAAVEQIADRILCLEAGQQVTDGLVDLQQGY